jgi:hypothetical protein
VEGLFRESVDTVEGKAQHERVDAKTTKLPKPEEDKAEQIHSRSVTLSSEQHHVIAKMDLAEAAGGLVTPVDYKHSAPRETENGCGTVAHGSHSAGYCLLPKDSSASARRVRRRIDGRNAACNCGGLGTRPLWNDSLAPCGLAEVSGLLASDYLPS